MLLNIKNIDEVSKQSLRDADSRQTRSSAMYAFVFVLTVCA